jgi:hypothetical protein
MEQRRFKAVPVGKRVRDSIRLIGRAGEYDVHEAESRNGQLRDVQHTALKLGVNIIQIRSADARVLPLCPLRVVMGVPNLCWRGRSATSESHYVVVIASKRSEAWVEHCSAGTTLEQRGLVVQIESNQEPAYQVWCDRKMVLK